MSYEQIVELQGYAKFFLILTVFIIFWSYIYSIYRRDKTGERDFEAYSKLVLDDDISSEPLEDRKDNKEVEDESQKKES
jgi:cytochrome c oxidase cbb3-type subunit 4